MPFLNWIFIFLLATVAANFEEVAPSTYTREDCLAYLQDADICDDPCHEQYESSALKEPDADLDAEETVDYRAVLAKYIEDVLKNNVTLTCEGTAFCSAYLHKCQTCGTSSIWHRSEFLDSDGEIQVHPVIGSQKRTWNGYEPVKHSAPWNVYVQSVISNYGYFVCGGTLIDAYTVVTAGHCVEDVDYTNLYFGVHERCVTMTAGCRDIGTGYFNFNVTEVGIQYRVVKPNNTIIHEDYMQKTRGDYLTKFQNDIAILKLDVPVLFSHKVSPACLPTGLPVDYYRKGNESHLFLAGAWGTIEDDTFGDYYRQIAVQEQQSDSSFGTPDMWISVRHPTNGDENSKFRSTCKGDSGSGLMAIVDKKWTVVGLNSHGLACMHNDRTATGTFTNVIKYLPWIKQRMGE